MAGTAHHAAIFRAVAPLTGLAENMVPFTITTNPPTFKNPFSAIPASVDIHSRQMMILSIAPEYLGPDRSFIKAI